MTSFSSILSSLGGPAKAPPQSSTAQTAAPSNNEMRKLTTTTNGAMLTPNNAAAGVKRKSEAPEAAPRMKTAKSGPDHPPNTTVPSNTTVPPNRFQLSAKGAGSSKPTTARPSSTPRPNPASPHQKPTPNRAPAPKPKQAPPSSPPATGPATPKRGFAGIMAKATLAQEAAKATSASGIKHKAASKPSKRERLRLMEEAKSAPKGTKHRNQIVPERSRSRSRTPVPTKKKAAPLAYKGTMRAVGSGGAAGDKPKLKGQPQDRYGGYARWSDLEDADEEDEEGGEGYASDVSSDMEGGWDEVAREEAFAERVAEKEDEEALREEARHRREKKERKRRLQELSRHAAARRK